jgi:effector-binding domain-containing protein
MQKLLFAIAGILLLLIAVGLALPRHATVSTTTLIDANPATVFALVNDPRRTALWSPWIDSDPNARISYSGPDRGVGAAMAWDGMIIGSGTQIITESRPYRYVENAINPGEPGSARSWFDLEGNNGATTAKWTFEADYGYNLVGRYFAMLLTSVVRRDYSRGLSKLKELAETLPKADFSDLEIEHIVIEAMDIAYLPAKSTLEPAAISAAMGDAFFDILTFIDRQGLQEAGAPISITRSFNGAELRFDAAIPVRGVSAAMPRDGAGVRIGSTYAGSVIRVKHVGSYRTLEKTHRKIAAYMAALGISRNGDDWESYVTDPTRVAEAQLLTYVYYPIR